jgi:hypothetical protein
MYVVLPVRRRPSGALRFVDMSVVYRVGKAVLFGRRRV